MLRIQTERGTNTLIPTRKEYVEFYQMNSERFARALKTAVIMHPGPVNHGVELTSELFNDPRSLILKQVAFGVPIRMAVIQLLFASRTN
jgi:aspartate carbamoyltransferase catalytic subunit